MRARPGPLESKPQTEQNAQQRGCPAGILNASQNQRGYYYDGESRRAVPAEQQETWREQRPDARISKRYSDLRHMYLRCVMHDIPIRDLEVMAHKNTQLQAAIDALKAAIVAYSETHTKLLQHRLDKPGGD
jgi:hypothetical protein